MFNVDDYEPMSGRRYGGTGGRFRSSEQVPGTAIRAFDIMTSLLANDDFEKRSKRWNYEPNKPSRVRSLDTCAASNGGGGSRHRLDGATQ